MGGDSLTLQDKRQRTKIQKLQQRIRDKQQEMIKDNPAANVNGVRKLIRS